MPKQSKIVRQTNPLGAVAAICLCLIGMSWVVFGQTLTHDFVNYDDQGYIFENAQVTSGLTIHGILWAFTHTHSFNWHPLTWISHMLDCQFFGLHSGGHHFTSVLLHSLAAVLLFLVLRQMTNALWRSAFVAAVFAIHPLHVESVAWVAERKDVLSGLFFLLTIGAYVRYVRSPAPSRYLMVCLFFALGLMSKPMLVTLPLVLLILDYWPLNRLAEASRKKPKGKQINSRQNSVITLVREKIPLFALSVASCAVTLVAQKHAIAPVDQLPLTPRLANACLSGAIYLRQMFVPLRLSPLYLFSAKSPVSAEVLLSVAVLLAVSVAAIASRKRHPYFLAGWLWYWVMLFPVLGIIQVGWQAHADRYTYLPHIGLYLALTWAVADLSRSWPRRRNIMTALSGLVIVILAWLAWEQTSSWRDSESLWRHALIVTPDNHIASTNLGDSLLKKSRTDDAIAQYQNSLRLDRTDSDAENGMGSALFRKEQGDQAIEHYQRAVALRPEDPEFHNNLGNALCYKGRIDDGIANYRKAIELRPDRADLNNAETEFNLANALLRKNEIEDAVLHYRRALEIQPNDADTNDNLATALLRKGQGAEAMEYFQKALQINPESASIRSDFAWALATGPEPLLRNGQRAVDLAEKARQLVSGQDPIILRTLAAAYAENAQFSQAIETAGNALRLAAAQRNTPLVRTLEKELELYQAGLPFHEAAR